MSQPWPLQNWREHGNWQGAQLEESKQNLHNSNRKQYFQVGMILQDNRIIIIIKIIFIIPTPMYWNYLYSLQFVLHVYKWGNVLFPKTFFLVERHALTRAAAMVRARILKCHYSIETLLLVKNRISLCLSLRQYSCINGIDTWTIHRFATGCRGDRWISQNDTVVSQPGQIIRFLCSKVTRAFGWCRIGRSLLRFKKNKNKKWVQ